VDAHRVDVLHVTDGDAVVPSVTHHLVFDLLPAAQVLFDQHLGHAVCEGATQRLVEIGLDLDDAAALTTQGEAHAQHHGETDLASRGAGFVGRAAGTAARGGHADLR
jgi:hypothetical protein